MPSHQLVVLVVKSFTSHMAHKLAQISAYSLQPSTGLHCGTKDMGLVCIVSCACLLPSFHWHSFCLPRGMARLSWSGCTQYPQTVTHPNTNVHLRHECGINVIVIFIITRLGNRSFHGFERTLCQQNSLSRTLNVLHFSGSICLTVTQVHSDFSFYHAI